MNRGPSVRVDSRARFDDNGCMKSYRKELWFNVTTRRAFINLTPQVEQCLRDSGIRVSCRLAIEPNFESGPLVEHEIVNPGFTILTGEDLFSFCFVEYAEFFSEFAVRAAKNISYVKAHPNLEANPEKDDVLYMSPIPWVSFTSFTHPMHFHPVDSIPRFAWGKYFLEGDTLRMPLSVQGHHAVMDGIHLGRFYEAVQDYLHHPEVVMGAA